MTTICKEGFQLTEDYQKLIYGVNHNPHGCLGIQPYVNGTTIIRLWRPGAENVYLDVLGETVQATRVDDNGIFEYVVSKKITHFDYSVYHQSGLLAQDPYSLFPSFGDVDQYLFSKGVHYQLYNAMGATLATSQGVTGTSFVVWAPSAQSVALVGDFNSWNGATNPMRSMGGCGVWELFVPALGEGEKYKFEIRTQTGSILLKSDPYAFSSELRPQTASVVADVDSYEWGDSEWMDNRLANKDESRPMNIYEVHLGSWNRHDDKELNARELAHRLSAYCKHMGFTDVELLPVAEHPLDESWGYQVTGFYAFTKRYGLPKDFQYFVDCLHKNGIGVILDWVPAHFPTDDFSLSHFDGTCLYEHSDSRQGFHPHWKTCIFNYGRHEVTNFLIANALFWLDKMHIDGLRVDAVASMIYLDYGREDGEWIPNKYGGKENLDAIEFMKHLNSVVHEKYPGALMIAEESTDFAKISHSLEYGGMGFDMKWNMGWMNDTLSYFSEDPMYRSHHHSDLTFGLLYAFSERFALVLSHDEVVHGKRSLLDKMPGDLWQKFANLRLLYSYMMCQPGKNLLFMGGEIGQWSEWFCKVEMDWHLLQYPLHKGIQDMVRDINHFSLEHSQLWENDFDWTGFEWIDFADAQNSVISYLRKDRSGRFLICVHNFTPQYHSEYFVRFPNASYIKEVFNTDAEKYGGSGRQNHHIEVVRDWTGKPEGFKVAVAPLATMVFEAHY
jgi:1,4-alpha-glucan branching enzyme